MNSLLVESDLLGPLSKSRDIVLFELFSDLNWSVFVLFELSVRDMSL